MEGDLELHSRWDLDNRELLNKKCTRRRCFKAYKPSSLAEPQFTESWGGMRRGGVLRWRPTHRLWSGYEEVDELKPQKY